MIVQVWPDQDPWPSAAHEADGTGAGPAAEDRAGGVVPQGGGPNLRARHGRTALLPGPGGGGSLQQSLRLHRGHRKVSQSCMLAVCN